MLNKLSYFDSYLRISKIIKSKTLLLVNRAKILGGVDINPIEVNSSDDVNKELCSLVMSEPEKFEKLNFFMKLFGLQIGKRAYKFIVFNRNFIYYPQEGRLFIDER